jgi:hypothetical protein
LKALNPNTCNQEDFATKTINYFKDQIEVGEDGEICEGTTFGLTATGGSVYAWRADDNTFTSSNPSPVVQPARTTKYFVTVTDAHGCFRKDTTQVTVLDSVDLKWQHHFKGNCTDLPSILVQNLTSPEDDVTFRFDFGDGTTSDEIEIEHVYEKNGLYFLKFSAQKKFCAFEEIVQLPVYKLSVPNVFTPEGSPGYNDNFEIGFGPDVIAPADVGLPLQLTVVNRWGNKVFESQDYKNDWNAHGLEGGVYFIHIKVGDFAACKNWVHIVK